MKLGIIGGSGLYALAGFSYTGEVNKETPFGYPSAPIMTGMMQGQEICFIPRHGPRHHLLPAEVPYKANIYALKSLGVTHILAFSAVGIMQDNINPGDLVIPDQVVDLTKHRGESSFFGKGLVGHVSLADPFCREFSQLLHKVCADRLLGPTFSGIYICIEGPRFSTRSESSFYRQSYNAAVIGMTAMPEAGLAREAEIAYSLVAMATDYDCWSETEDDVNAQAVLQILQENQRRAMALIEAVVSRMGEFTKCSCHQAASQALVTQPEHVPLHLQHQLGPLYGAYWGHKTVPPRREPRPRGATLA